MDDAAPRTARTVAATVMVEPLRLPALQSLRLFDTDDDAVRRASEAIGFELARPANRLTDGSPRSVRLGPGEWLVFGGDAVSIRAGLESITHQVHEVGPGRVGWLVSGANAAALINAGCSIDLHERAFPPGACLRTLMAKAGVLLGRPDMQARFEIIAEAALQHYLSAWLDDAAISLRP